MNATWQGKLFFGYEICIILFLSCMLVKKIWDFTSRVDVMCTPTRRALYYAALFIMGKTKCSALVI